MYNTNSELSQNLLKRVRNNNFENKNPKETLSSIQNTTKHSMNFFKDPIP